MASQRPYPSAVGSGKLFSIEERKTCLDLCVADDELMRKRAKALLALDEGCTQVEAAALSGLTRGQVNYILRRFQKNGLNILATPMDIDPQQVRTGEVDDDKKLLKKKEKKKKKKAKGEKERDKLETKFAKMDAVAKKTAKKDKKRKKKKKKKKELKE